MATRVDINLIRGDSRNIIFELTDNGTPVDLTNCTVFFTAKPTIADEATDATAVIRKVVTEHEEPTTGRTTIPLTPSDTNITPGEYFYDIQVKKADNSIVSIPVRKLRVVGDISRDVS